MPEENGQRTAPRTEFSTFDDQLLHDAVRDAGRWAFGTAFAEMWVLSEDKTCLFRPDGAWWVDPCYHHQRHDTATQEGSDCPVCRLIDQNTASFVEPRPLVPSEGLPGVLWSESANTSTFGSWLRRGGSSPASSRNYSHGGGSRDVLPDHSGGGRVVWRQVKSIVDDPDQPFNLRLQVLGSLGLGWAAAVRFSLHGSQGILVYMARDCVNQANLQSPTNELYLQAAADFCGAAYALRGPRRQMEEERYRERSVAWRQVRTKLLLMIRSGVDVSTLLEKPASGDGKEAASASQPDDASVVRNAQTLLRDLIRRIFRKAKGGGAQLPPVLTWKQTFLTFVGVFATLLSVARVNVALVDSFGGDYAIVMGPFGALVTLLYGLTAAPASQPRNALLGQAVSLGIAMAFGQIENLDLWLRQSLATAVAVSLMVKLGVTHPPAGASCLIFSSGRFDWTNVATIFLGNIIAISAATVINNYSQKRQYPMYWALVGSSPKVRTMQQQKTK